MLYPLVLAGTFGSSVNERGELAVSRDEKRSVRKGRRRSLLADRAGKQLLRLRVNGQEMEIASETAKTLLEVLREDLGLTGTKHGCELGECGTCTVLMDGKPVLSCLVLGVEAEGADVATIEGMMQGGQPHPLQRAFADLGAAQCGYC